MVRVSMAPVRGRDRVHIVELVAIVEDHKIVAIDPHTDIARVNIVPGGADSHNFQLAADYPAEEDYNLFCRD
jgi:hypothetical protein